MNRVRGPDLGMMTGGMLRGSPSKRWTFAILLLVSCGQAGSGATNGDGGASPQADARSGSDATTSPCASAYPLEESLPVWTCPSSAPAAGDWCCGGQGTVCSYDCSGRSLLAQNLGGPVGACFETDAGCIPTAETIAAACGSNEQYQVNFNECDLLGEAGTGGDGGCPAAAPTLCTDCIGAAYCTLGACPAAACQASTGYPFPVPPSGDTGDAGGDAGAFDAIRALCAGSAPRPLTAGSYVEPMSGLTVHWPSGWTFTSASGSATATLTTPITWIPTGSTTPEAGEAEFSILVGYYGSASQPSQALQGETEESATSSGNGSILTLAGQPALVWWYLSPVPEPECPAPCGGSPPLPELMTVDGLVEFTTVDAGVGFGLELDLEGAARANAQPQQVFCDMEAMILGVTLTR
jgi:hypothetical protein